MRNAKFYVALVMALFAFLRSYSGIDLGMDEATANTIVAALTAALVWIVPNREKPKSDDPDYSGAV